MENKELYMEDLDIEIMGIICDDWSPKNGKKAIVKGSNGKEIVIKAIDIKGLLFATVVAAGITDLDGQKITNEEVEKSCWNYQKRVMEKGFKADINHDKKELDGVELVENYVDRYNADYSHNIVLDFSKNKELMEKAAKSSINGISPSGRANIVEKGAFEKAFDKIAAVFRISKAETLDNYNKTEPSRNLYRAWNAFYSAVIDWNESKGEFIKVTPEEYQKNVDDLNVILKTINIEKGADMKKELEDFIKTDEGKKELETAGYVMKAAETSKETPPAEEPKKEPETISKAVFETYKTETEAKITELKTQLVEIAKGNKAGTDELVPDLDINKMSEDQLKTLRETQPDAYQAALKAAAEKAKRK